MRSITLFLDQAAEERDRDRKRANRRLLAVMILALFALLLLAQSPRGTEPVAVPVPMPVLIAVPGASVLPGSGGTGVVVVRKEPATKPAVSDPEPLDFWHGLPPQIASGPEPQRHLCVTPRFAVLRPGERQHITVSNSGTDEVRITAIRFRNASAIAVDSTDCYGRTLTQGERCAIEVTASANAKYLELSVIDHDGDEETLRVLVSARP